MNSESAKLYRGIQSIIQANEPPTPPLPLHPLRYWCGGDGSKFSCLQTVIQFIMRVLAVMRQWSVFIVEDSGAKSLFSLLTAQSKVPELIHRD